MKRLPLFVKARLSEATGNIIFRLPLVGPGEDYVCFVKLYQFSHIKETGIIGDPGGLLHVMGDNHDGVIHFQRVDQLLERSGMLRRLETAGVPEKDIPSLATEAAQQWTAQFNPVEMTAAKFEELYRAAM